MVQALSKITILGRDFEVKRVTAKHLEMVSKDPGNLGCLDGDVIYLSRALTEDQMKRVLMHEVTHAIMRVSGMTNLLSEKHEEAICDAMESIVDLFRDKQLSQFLSK